MEIYVVRGGDSLYGIARRYGTDAAELARINQLNDPARLLPQHCHCPEGERRAGGAAVHRARLRRPRQVRRPRDNNDL